MAIPGAKPKPQGHAVTRHKQVHEWTEVENRPFEGGPKLPYRYVQLETEDGVTELRVAWPAATKRWWSVVSTMPHCVLWTAADWEYAIETAEVHARFTQRATNGTELRIRQKLLGTTLDSLRDLRIRYVDPKPAALEGDAADAAGVLNLDDYR
jgi:hypothetical protein